MDEINPEDWIPGILDLNNMPDLFGLLDREPDNNHANSFRYTHQGMENYQDLDHSFYSTSTVQGSASPPQTVDPELVMTRIPTGALSLQTSELQAGAPGQLLKPPEALFGSFGMDSRCPPTIFVDKHEGLSPSFGQSASSYGGFNNWNPIPPVTETSIDEYIARMPPSCLSTQSYGGFDMGNQAPLSTTPEPIHVPGQMPNCEAQPAASMEKVPLGLRSSSIVPKYVQLCLNFLQDMPDEDVMQHLTRELKKSILNNEIKNILDRCMLVPKGQIDDWDSCHQLKANAVRQICRLLLTDAYGERKRTPEATNLTLQKCTTDGAYVQTYQLTVLLVDRFCGATKDLSFIFSLFEKLRIYNKFNERNTISLIIRLVHRLHSLPENFIYKVNVPIDMANLDNYMQRVIKTFGLCCQQDTTFTWKPLEEYQNIQQRLANINPGATLLPRTLKTLQEWGLDPINTYPGSQGINPSFDLAMPEFSGTKLEELPLLLHWWESV